MSQIPHHESMATSVGVRATEWLQANINWFDADNWAARLPPLEVPEQPLIELLLLRHLADVGGRDIHGLGESAERLALAAVDRPTLRRRLAEAGPGAPYALLLLGLLGDAAPPKLGRLAQRTLDRYGHGRTLSRLDFGPTLALELRLAAELGSWSHDLPGFAELRGENPYDHLDPVVLSEQEAYALTHDILYATAGGAVPLPSNEAAVERTRWVLTSLLGATALEGQLDLTAELLVCHAVLGGVADNPARAMAWHALAEAQHDDGSLPSPAFVPQLIEDAATHMKDAMIFRTCYHTTVVTAMAAITEPLGGPVPPDAVTPAPRLADCAPQTLPTELAGAALVAAARVNDTDRTTSLLEAMDRFDRVDELALAGARARLEALADLAALGES